MKPSKKAVMVARAAGWRAVFIWLCASAFSGASFSSEVVDLPPDQVRVFVDQNPKVVLLFTSPDPNCGYCKGTADMFAEGVRSHGRADWRYALVQWPRWKQQPDLGTGIKVYGVPDHQVYVDGAYVRGAGGRAKSADELMVSIERAQDGKPRQNKAVDITPELEEGLKAYGGRKVLVGTLFECERRFHESKSVYAKEINGWIDSRSGPLKIGTRAMLSTLGLPSNPFAPTVKKHVSAIEVTINREFGIDGSESLTPKKCDQLAGALDRF